MFSFRFSPAGTRSGFAQKVDPSGTIWLILRARVPSPASARSTKQKWREEVEIECPPSVVRGEGEARPQYSLVLSCYPILGVFDFWLGHDVRGPLVVSWRVDVEKEILSTGQIG